MKKCYKKLNEYIEEAKEFYVFDEEGNLYSYKNNKLKALKKISNSNSFKFGTIGSKDKSVSAKNLKNTFKLLKKNIVIEINEQLELNLNIKTKEVNINELFQLSSFDERFKDYYYFNSDGKLYSAKRGYKELKLQKTNNYHICSIDGKRTSISPTYLRALIGKGFENAIDSAKRGYKELKLQKTNNYHICSIDGKRTSISPTYLRALIGKGFENAIEPIEGEEWKWIEGYEGIYKISNCGRVVNFKGELSPSLAKGYYQIILCREGQTKTYRIHSLVAKHFVEGYEEGLVVNHKDLNKTNNRAENLEWVSQKENIIHYYQNKNKLVS